MFVYSPAMVLKKTRALYENERAEIEIAEKGSRRSIPLS